MIIPSLLASACSIMFIMFESLILCFMSKYTEAMYRFFSLLISSEYTQVSLSDRFALKRQALAERVEA